MFLIWDPNSSILIASLFGNAFHNYRRPKTTFERNMFIGLDIQHLNYLVAHWENMHTLHRFILASLTFSKFNKKTELVF